MRLIDADALLKHKSDHEIISTHLIWNAPTVDAVPVIRCKDCKKFVVEEDQAYCLDMYGQCDENGFCSWAERRRRMTAQWWAEFLTAFILIRIGIIAWRRWKGKKND